MQKIALLGSTGSIGVNALSVISRFKDRFRVEALSAYSNIGLLRSQVKIFKPKYVSVVDPLKAKEFKSNYLDKDIVFYEGEEGLLRMLEHVKVDILIVAIVGSGALLPIMHSIPRIKRLALANKEALVMAGDIIIEKAVDNNVTIMPIDSEHSAIFQCLSEHNKSYLKKIYLTGSGGPFLNLPSRAFKDITPKKAINHPRWKMGKKISVDSATLMNKGLEVIEAHHLFGIESYNIDVLIHPEAIIHSMVEFCDNSILAQLGLCDMRAPIQYALTYPERCRASLEKINFPKIACFSFFKPDFKRFPCLAIAYHAARLGRTYPCVLNASNEVTVEAFLKNKISFADIPRVIEKIVALHKSVKDPGLGDILDADTWAKAKTKEFI